MTYRYDAAGRPVSLCSNIANQPCYVSNASSTALSQPAQWTYGNGVVQGWTYADAQARLTNIQIGLGQTGSGVDPNSLFDRSYGYDGVGNLLRIDNNRLGQRQNYSYDARDRLTRWWTTGIDESYSYDLIGNLSSKAGVSYSYGSGGNATGVGPHQARSVGGQSYTYDANGNLLSGGGRTLTWNAQNQPRSVTGTDGITEQYRYDPGGARVQRLRGSVSTLYFQGLWEETPNVQQLKLLHQQTGRSSVHWCGGEVWRAYRPSKNLFFYLLSGCGVMPISVDYAPDMGSFGGVAAPPRKHFSHLLYPNVV